MGSLEGIVRPFSTPDITPPSPVPIAQEVPVSNVVINPGKGGSVKTMSGSYNLTVTFYLIRKPKEKTTS